MNRLTALLTALLVAGLIAAAVPVVANAQATAVSSSAQLVADRVGDASPAADLTAFSLSQDKRFIHFGWTFAPTVDMKDPKLAVCTVGHARSACIEEGRVRIANRYYKLKLTYAAHSVKVSIPVGALGYPSKADSRTIKFRAKVGYMASECGGPCTDFSAPAVSSIEL